MSNIISQVHDVLKKTIKGIDIKSILIDNIVKNPYSEILYVRVLTSGDNLDLVVKIPSSKDSLNRIVGEFESYRKLHSLLKGSEFSTLETIGYLKSPPSLISYRVEGLELSNIIRSNKFKQHKGKQNNKYSYLEDVLKKCGNLLGFYHKNYILDTNSLANDKNDKLDRILNKLGYDGNILSNITLDMKCMNYKDFTPWNIIVTKQGGICILDPPHKIHLEYIHSDLARFRLGLVRGLYHPLWMLHNHDLPVNLLYDSFLEGYQETSGYSLSEADNVLIDAYEIELWHGVLDTALERIRMHPRESFKILIGQIRIWLLERKRIRTP